MLFRSGAGSSSSSSGGASSSSSSASKVKTPSLDEFGTDLTLAASELRLDPVVGREKEIVDSWLNAQFQGSRHQKRIGMLDN